MKRIMTGYEKKREGRKVEVMKQIKVTGEKRGRE